MHTIIEFLNTYVVQKMVIFRQTILWRLPLVSVGIDYRWMNLKSSTQFSVDECSFTPPKSQFHDGIFYQVVLWFSRGLSGT